MVDAIIFLILFGCSFLWIISYKMEPRRLINGFFFMLSYVSIVFMFSLIGSVYEIPSLLTLTAGVILFSVLIVPFSVVSFLIALWTTSIRLIHREGNKFKNFIGIFFGLIIILWLVFIPYLSSLELPVFPSYLLLIVSEGVTYILFMFAVYLIAAITYGLFRKRKAVDYVIVLGGGLIGDKVPPLLASRIMKAIEVAHKQEQSGKQLPTLVFSGGKGSDELVSEAEAMQKYAVEAGFPIEKTIIEKASTNTKENFIFSKKILDMQAPNGYTSLFVTNNFHVFRASLWARQSGIDANGIGSKTRLYYALNALIREYAGVLAMKKRFHAIALLLLLAGSTTLFIIDQFI